MDLETDLMLRSKILQLTILIAAEGALKLPVVRSYADLEAAVGKLNSISAGEIRVSSDKQ